MTHCTHWPMPITDEMCAAALKVERAQRWHSDELRVWAMLAAAREAAPEASTSDPARAPVIAEDLDAFADGEKEHP